MTAITAETLGSWLVRCNPAKWDLAGYIAEGGEQVDSVSVVDNYRSAMMQPGDRILLWVSGNGRLLARGIWGLGHVTAKVRDEPADAVPDAESLWLDERTRRGVSHAVFVDIPLLDSPVTDAELRSHTIDDLEVQRVPMGSNPSWLSTEQLSRVRPLLPPWPRFSPRKGRMSG
jgi:hypothetical protein